MGTSAGGLHALLELLPALPVDYRLPLIIVQHRSKGEDMLLEEILQKKSLLRVKQADEKEIIRPGTVYIAPPDYHLMIESDETFSLSSDELVHFSRPSIDVLFRSAAEVYRKTLVGIVLTGANADGAAGLKAIHQEGGYTIVQEPSDAAYEAMPRAAIRTGVADMVIPLPEIIRFLKTTGLE
jgi:two-component system chemotaxis response regulator CheB